MAGGFQQDQAYPWASNPRRFVAVAMPNGDRAFGVAGELVFVSEQRGGCIDRPKYLSREEAEQLRDALSEALRTFDVGEAISSGLPVAARGYPFRGHRTLAEIDDCEWESAE